MQSTKPSFWKDRLKAATVHFSVSLVVVTLAALLVFCIWYPYPYREISGGRELFLLVVSVDVAMGPLITFAIFDRQKPWTELRRDMAVVVVLQLSALSYGLWTVAMARPVHLVFEIDRFRIIHAIEVPADWMDKAPKEINVLPLSGPSTLGLRPFRDGQEKMEATLAALQGIPLGARPDLWQTYDASRQDVLRVAMPVAQLRLRFPEKTSAIDAVLSDKGGGAVDARYVPLVARNSFWTVIVDGRQGDVLGFVPLDSF